MGAKPGQLENRKNKG